jgi:methylglutaconyl-CoA hydratase
MADFDTIRIDTDDRGVAYLWLARPDKHNALNTQMIAELRSAAAQLSADNAVRAVVLAGEGKSFCAGADLGWMQTQIDNDRDGKIAESQELARMLNGLDSLPKPLIGRVHGHAFGGGIGMMAVCDIVIASSQALFALTETRLGLIPATIGPYVVRRLGEGSARRVFMNGKRFGADVAHQLGLVSEVVDGSGLDQAIETELGWFLDCAPGAVADAKNLCLSLSRGAHVDPLADTAARLADRWETGEAREGIRCFFAREKPPWARKDRDSR